MKTTWKIFLRRRVVNSILAVLVLVGVVMVGLLWSLPAPVKAAGGGIEAPILFIHGFNGEKTAPSSAYAGYDCKNDLADPNGNNLGDASNYFLNPPPGINYSWVFGTIGYYGDSTHVGDTNCDAYLQNYQSYCTSVPTSAIGSNNEDLRHVGCELAWYIYENYTSVGLPVYVLAHSMGGLIIQWALEQAGTAPYPPALDVRAVVTMATPHSGIDGTANPWLALCNQCVQAAEMDPNGSFIQTLEGNLNPQGSGGTTWTTVASEDDQIITPSSALHMTGPKYVYSFANGGSGVSFPDYTHTGLFADESAAQDASVLDCLGSCAAPSGTPTGYTLVSNTNHSLALAYNLLGQSIVQPGQPLTTTQVPNPCGGPVCNTVGAGYDTTDWYVPQQIHAQFIVPSLAGLPGSGTSIWIGFNNDPTHSGSSNAGGYAVRVGVNGTFDSKGNLTYEAFWSVQQVFDTAHNTSTGVWSSDMLWLEGNTAVVRVYPGDKVGVTLWFSGSTVYFDFTDFNLHTGTIRNHSTTTPGFKVYSANWMVSNVFGLYTVGGPALADWSGSGFIFTDCQIMVNGTWVPITYKHYNTMVFTTGTGETLATPGGLGSGRTSFGVTFNGAD
jgi:hypothetical protein